MDAKYLKNATVEKIIALWETINSLEQQLAELKASLPKVRADAVRGLIITIIGAIENGYISMREFEEMDLEDFCNLAEKHADKLEADNG